MYKIKTLKTYHVLFYKQSNKSFFKPSALSPAIKLEGDRAVKHLMKDLRPAEKDFNKVATLSSLCERREGNTATKEMEDFYEWLRGFVYAEGYFSITSNRNAYTFTFGIGLHIDDLDVLKYIQKTLQVGTVFMKPKVAELVVRRLD